MVHIPPFEVTIWIEKLEDGCKYDLATTCASSISLEELEALSQDPSTTSQALSPRQLKLSYGGIVANQIVLQALLSRGDHAVVMYPTYEQLYQTPRMLGAEVTLWKLEPASSVKENKWSLDLDFLRSSIKPNTKMIVLNSPNNPTGAHLSTEVQREIIAIARAHDLIVFCDEVFYPLFRLGEDHPQSFLDLGYEKTIVIGSLSKAYSLAGTRIGWIASTSPDLVEINAAMRHYTTISVSRIDEAIAAEALGERCRGPLLARAKRLADTNIAALEKFIDEHAECSWSKPVAGNTAMLLFTRNGTPVDDREFCLRLLRRTGVLLCPATVCFSDASRGDFKGYVRVGVAIDTVEMEGALEEMRRFMREDFADVPLAQG